MQRWTAVGSSQCFLSDSVYAAKKFWVFGELFLHFPACVHDGRMVPIAEHTTDGLVGGVSPFSDQVHGQPLARTTLALRPGPFIASSV